MSETKSCDLAPVMEAICTSSRLTGTEHTTIGNAIASSEARLHDNIGVLGLSQIKSNCDLEARLHDNIGVVGLDIQKATCDLQKAVSDAEGRLSQNVFLATKDVKDNVDRFGFKNIDLSQANNAAIFSTSKDALIEILKSKCEIKEQASDNTCRLERQAADNYASVQLEALKNKQALAAQLAECCCDLKERLALQHCEIKESIVSNTRGTQDLINKLETDKLREALSGCKQENLIRELIGRNNRSCGCGSGGGNGNGNTIGSGNGNGNGNGNISF